MEIMLVLKSDNRENISYSSINGWRMKREADGITSNGNPFNNRWVLRNLAGNFMDIDANRHDLAERNGFGVDHAIGE